MVNNPPLQALTSYQLVRDGMDQQTMMIFCIEYDEMLGWLFESVEEEEKI